MNAAIRTLCWIAPNIDPGFALQIDPPGWPDYGSGFALFLRFVSL